MNARRISAVAPLAAGMAIVLVAMAVQAAETPDKPKRTGDVYTLDTCPVTGKKLGSMGDPVVKVYDGREVRFCCAGCIKKFEASQEEYIEKIDAAMVKQQLPFYPLTTCVVLGGKLGDMGKPVDVVVGNRLVRLCCKGCQTKLEETPGEFIAKLDKAVIEKQKDTYPLDTCVVTGDKLGGDMGDPVEYVAGNRLIRFCCKGCIKEFEKNPAKYLKILDDAKAGKKASMPAEGSHGGH